jgi:predicted RNA binding protein YcfA (HicA-like mRNA interferase family)
MALRPIVLLDRMRRNPQNDWSIHDVEKLCREVGLLCEPPRGGGSHFKVSHPQSPTILTIPYKRPIKPVYVRKLVKLADWVRNR